MLIYAVAWFGLAYTCVRKCAFKKKIFFWMLNFDWKHLRLCLFWNKNLKENKKVDFVNIFFILHSNRASGYLKDSIIMQLVNKSFRMIWLVIKLHVLRNRKWKKNPSLQFRKVIMVDRKTNCDYPIIRGNNEKGKNFAISLGTD